MQHLPLQVSKTQTLLFVCSLTAVNTLYNLDFLPRFSVTWVISVVLAHMQGFPQNITHQRCRSSQVLLKEWKLTLMSLFSGKHLLTV